MADDAHSSKTAEPPDARFLLAAPGVAFHLAPLIAVWAAGLFAHAVMCWFSGPLGSTVAVLGGATVLLLAWTWVAAIAAGEASGGTIPAIRPLARLVPGRLPSLLFAFLATFLFPALCLSVALAGALLGLVPLAGPWLVIPWYGVSLVLCFLAAAWLVVGVPALTLQVPAAAVEFPHAFELFSRTFSYVRRRPVRLAAGWIAVVLAALAATVPFWAMVDAVMVFFQGVVDVAGGTLPRPVETARTVLTFWERTDAWCPVGSCSPGGGGSFPIWMFLLGRLVPAFFLTCVFAGSTRLYLVLRRSVDGTGVAAGQAD